MDESKLLLKKLFQSGNNNLDFGIYRIMNIKQKEITTFIERDLAEIIKKHIKSGGNEQVIYDDLIGFFSRYYEKGDFVSKRRASKDAKYSIPYSGEDVYLYWANNDQYYIKTTENFKNYTFKAGQIRVDFEVSSEDVDVEKNNIKDTEKKFFVFKDMDYDAKQTILKVFFGYRGVTDEESKTIKASTGKKTISRDVTNKYNLTRINAKIGQFCLSKLQEKHIIQGGDGSGNGALEWHLDKFTTKDTSDYFIHKNLKQFLAQELDFYIKSELLSVDNVDSLDDLSFNLKRIKGMKEIALKLIDILAQIENLQKKLWEKKKFVISTDYCITVDYINEKHYPEILGNDRQVAEWKKLFCFDVQRELRLLRGTPTLTSFGKGEGEALKELLKRNPSLVVDTKFFDEGFKFQILSEIEDLDEKITGILINSENFQALSLLSGKFCSKMDCIYVDPPYNTTENTFLYKNNYKHSSWLAMAHDRICQGMNLLDNGGVLCMAIDDTEVANLRGLLDGLFGSRNRVATIAVEVNPAGQNIRPDVPALSHDYTLLYAKDIDSIEMNYRSLTDAEKGAYKETDEKGAFYWDNLRRRGGNSRPTDRPNQWFPIYVDVENDIIRTDKFTNATEVWPIDPKGIKRVWRYNKEGVEKELKKGEISYKMIGTEIRLLKKSRIPEGKKPKTFWHDPKYSGTSWGTKLLIDILGERKFSYPKSVYLVKDIVSFWTDPDSWVLDFFAGSGTTAHAVHMLNKEDDGNRKYVLIEMEKYFESVLKPRVLKIVYSMNWKDGKPQDKDGSRKQIIKYQSLEQYEDTLNNIFFEEPIRSGEGPEDRKIRYVLEHGSKASDVLLDIGELENPFKYTMKIDNTKEVNVDLVETFNYIARIEVRSIQRMLDEKTEYVIVKGKRNEKSVVVIWRDKTNAFDPVRDKSFIEREVLKESFEEILVNGNSLVKNASSLEEILKTNMFG